MTLGPRRSPPSEVGVRRVTTVRGLSSLLAGPSSTDAVTADSAAADTLARALETLMVRVKRPLVIGGSSAFEADLDSIAFLEPITKNNEPTKLFSHRLGNLLLKTFC